MNLANGTAIQPVTGKIKGITRLEGPVGSFKDFKFDSDK